MRSRRVKLEGRYIYHCMSRVIERLFVLGDQEKEYFRGLMRRCEGFCGVRIVTYAILDNHFHILVEVPALKPLGEKALMERMRLLYSPEYMEEVRAQWALWRKQGHEKLVKRDQARYQARMGDVSEFMKTLKQRFTQWFNRQDGRAKREAGPGTPEATDVDVIDVSEYHPPRIPSKKWRELIKKVWEVDPLICPHCGAEMKLIALIDDQSVIEKILRHLKLWPEQEAPACLSRAPPPDGGERIIEPFFDDPFPDYDTEPVYLSSEALV